MHLSRFEVQGFKNFSERLVLDSLGPLHVIHGANNIGKSNLLEAIALFFRLLSYVEGEAGRQLPIAAPATLTAREFEVLTRQTLADILHFVEPTPVVLAGRVSFKPGELEDAGYRHKVDAQHVDIRIELTPASGKVDWQIRQFRYASGEDAAQKRTESLEIPTHDLTVFMVRNFIAPSDQSSNNESTFTLIQLDRTRLGQRASAQSVDRGIVPANVSLSLYDARESEDPRLLGRWQLFQEAMGWFRDITGPGTINVIYKREVPEARLVLENGTRRIPMHLLGSGPQQLAAMLGQLLVCGSTIIAIEEPELNLRRDLQARLGEALLRILQDPRGPSQLLLTSHSDAFEENATVDLLEINAQGGHTTRRLSAGEARRATQIELEPPRAQRAPLSYVTSQGVVRLPREVMQRICVPDGGGVVFVEDHLNPHTTRIMSNDTWLRAIGEETERDDDGSAA